jgi:hypothetical protein
MGQSAMSAKNSAEAEAPAHMKARYLTEFSSPTMVAYWSLKISLKPNLTMPWMC